MAGEGALFFFHGAYNERRDAVRKEAATPGSFIKPIYYQSGMRYAVLSPHSERNPEGHSVLRLCAPRAAGARSGPGRW